MGIIQERLGSILLSLRTSRNDRTPKVYTFENAKTIGIIYNAVDKDTHQRVANFAEYLSKTHIGIKVSMLGYLTMPELEKCLPTTVPTDYFTFDEFTWSGRLQRGKAYDFSKKRFDILLDLTTETTFPISYVQLLSKASYKVGRYIEDDLRHDLLIDIKNENTIAYLITQINVYLTKIKVKE